MGAFHFFDALILLNDIVEAIYKTQVSIPPTYLFLPKMSGQWQPCVNRVLSQVIAYNGFRLPTLAYGQLTVGDGINQRSDIS